MRNALPPTQLRNWSRGHMSCWLLTPARARQSGRPSQCVPSSLRTEIISRISSPLPPSPQEFLPAHRALSSEIFPAEETTFKLKLGPRHQVSLCTVSYILNFLGRGGFGRDLTRLRMQQKAGGCAESASPRLEILAEVTMTRREVLFSLGGVGGATLVARENFLNRAGVLPSFWKSRLTDIGFAVSRVRKGHV